MPDRLAAPPELVEVAGRGGWRLEVLGGSAEELHREPVVPQRTVRVNHVERAAIVLGSTQADPPRTLPSGVDLARRHSGGGAVWLFPGHQVWVDFVIPVSDALWEPDVGVSAHWLGSAWARCIGASAEVASPPMQHAELGSVACFAGLGPGEVSVAGSKVVGISQRRTRELARFQSVAYFIWDPGVLMSVLAPPDPVLRRLEGAVSSLGQVAPAAADGGEWGVVERLLDTVH